MATKLPVDQVFRNHLEKVSDFKFNEAVAGVFDDMVSRSVPFYGEMQRMIAELAASFATEGSNIYDLGCSTGTTISLLHQTLPVNAHLCGIDNSAEMLDRCRQKLAETDLDKVVELRLGDLDDGIEIENASVVLMVLTLMFVRPLNREKLMRRIHAGYERELVPASGREGARRRLVVQSLLHRALLRVSNAAMGYSELEISQKREALENVLIPYRLQENRNLLLGAGFREVEVFFKWYNFAGFVAVK
jgi:tRNA (cmo5U34)-methyltransferase